ncbi:MAG: DUF2933 domain-containing protein [Aromatoleum sp.]|uniref:DUF2933 domain-containing protein n=1 Tax=Aromatoleum sp. TaxID=2307007 RepID=UPI0028944B75|nr:DUF2933 domain-containing protein [Aromatoleum sp.]MDT3668892.1 DUF2933 domain-containing protein [Aromatoleum sp.]
MRGAPLPKIATSEHSGIPTGGADPRRSPLRGKWVFAGFLVLALLLLTTEHRAHLLGVLPWLLLLACPLMHLVMHGGHGHHHGHGSSASKDTTGDEN